MAKSKLIKLKLNPNQLEHRCIMRLAVQYKRTWNNSLKEIQEVGYVDLDKFNNSLFSLCAIDDLEAAIAKSDIDDIEKITTFMFRGGNLVTPIHDRLVFNFDDYNFSVECKGLSEEYEIVNPLFKRDWETWYIEFRVQE